MDEVNWRVIAAIVGVFGTVITSLLTWIGFLQKSINSRLEIRMDKQDERLDGQDQKINRHDEEIHELALSNREQLTILKHKLKIK